MQVSVRRLSLYPLGVARAALLSPSPRLLSPGTRTLFSETGVWEKEYRPETRRRVEEWWHPRIMAQWRKDALEEVRRLFTFCNIFLQRFSPWHPDNLSDTPFVSTHHRVQVFKSNVICKQYTVSSYVTTHPKYHLVRTTAQNQKWLESLLDHQTGCRFISPDACTFNCWGNSFSTETSGWFVFTQVLLSTTSRYLCFHFYKTLHFHSSSIWEVNIETLNYIYLTALVTFHSGEKYLQIFWIWMINWRMTSPFMGWENALNS